MIKLRQYLHTIPELSFQEYKTSKFIKEKLESFGIETYTICNTGIIGVLQSKVNKDCINIGIRADLDALPIEEINNVEHKSSHSGCMHACGHDGHMAIVLGVAEYFSKTMNFLGTIYFIFSPAEEEGGGCKKMLEDPLFNAFKIDEIYGLHNWPELEIGKIGVSDSIVMAGDDNFSIEIVGKSGHGAMPQFAINPIDYITDVLDYLKELQNLYDVILTPTNVSGGDCYNVIPDSVIINGTFRYLSKEERENVLYKLNNVNIDGININVTIIDGYPPTINNKECAQYCKKIVNNMNDVTLYDITTSSMATEDFSYLLEEIPGCYVWLGSKDDKHQAGLHNANYDFNDKILDIGFEYFKNIIINKSKFNPNPVFLGFIQVPTDYTLDVEINGILSQIDYIKWRLLKLPSVNDPNINSDMFHKLKDKIRETSSNFIPQPNDENIYGTINVISLACTSMSFVLTPKVVHDEIRAGYPTIANDMASSVLNAINAFKRTMWTFLTGEQQMIVTQK